jgi:hypothetical protein
VELNRPPGFLLYDHRTIANSGACNKIANLDPDEIAASQFAIDSEIKQGSIPHLPVSIQHEANSPDFLRLKRPLRSELSSRIPCRPAFYWIEIRMSHRLSPLAEIGHGKNAQLGGFWP